MGISKECKQKVFDFIESKTMKDYLQSINRDFSEMDVLAVAYQSNFTIKQKIDYFYELQKEKKVSNQFIKQLNRLVISMENKLKYTQQQRTNNVFKVEVLEENEFGSYGIFSSIYQAKKEIEEDLDDGILEAKDMISEYRPWVRVEELDLESDLKSKFVGSYSYNKHMELICYEEYGKELDNQRPENRYVHFSNPFKQGDIVRSVIYDGYYVVIDSGSVKEHLIDLCDAVDHSIMVIPLIDYSRYISSEERVDKISYDKNEKEKGRMVFTNFDDLVSCSHEHIKTLTLEYVGCFNELVK